VHFHRLLMQLLVGGMAQSLGRWSLTGGLSVIYACYLFDMWPLCG